jgi:hypothetical protein
MKRVLVSTPRTYGGQRHVYSGDDLSYPALATGRIGYSTRIDTNEEVHVSNIDRQRVAAVKAMEALGYTFDGLTWNAPRSDAMWAELVHQADAMHALLVLRADKLEGCTEGSAEKVEFKSIADAVEAYEAKRWPNGSVPSGKGE